MSEGAIQIVPNKFVHYRVYDGTVFMLSDDIARAVGYASTSLISGSVAALNSDSGIGLTSPKSYLFFEGRQRLFWGKSAFLDFCRRSRESKVSTGGGRILLDKIAGLYSELENKTGSPVVLMKEKALRAYIIDDTMHIKFEGKEGTKATKAFYADGNLWVVHIKKKGYGKYTFNKSEVSKF